MAVEEQLRLGRIVLMFTLWLFVATPAAPQSLEEETRRPPGTNSLDDDSDRLRGADGTPPTDSLDDDSRDLRGRTPDQDGTNSLDDGSLQGGDRADPD